MSITLFILAPFLQFLNSKHFTDSYADHFVFIEWNLVAHLTGYEYIFFISLSLSKRLSRPYSVAAILHEYSHKGWMAQNPKEDIFFHNLCGIYLFVGCDSFQHSSLITCV